ncbi:MAG: hypothetical protein IKP00_01215 [Victivallales bacterium]|nr:hypothetical protein [Victivallales bacterium]
MSKGAFAFLLALLWCVILSANPIEVRVSFAEVALVLDGEATEATWDKAPWNEGFTKLGKKNIEAAEQARFKVLNDNNGLWFFWDCVDNSVKSEPRPLDDSIWHDDCIELFLSTSPDISPDRNIREYYQIIVNPAGSVFDAFNRGGAADTQWTSMTKAVGKLKEGGWQLEIYIPFAAFPNCRGGSWRFLCGRENWGKEYEPSSFPAALKFQEMDDYALLSGITIDPTRFDNELFSSDVLTELGNDAMNCFVKGIIKTAIVGKLDLKCRILDENGSQIDFVGDMMIPKDKAISFTLPVKIAKSGKYSFYFYLADEKGLVFTANVAKSIEIAPCSVETIWPFYRDNIYSTMKDKTARFKVTPLVSPAIFKECRIEVEVKLSSGKVIIPPKKLSPSELECFTVPLANVKPGKLLATFTMFRGEKLLGRMEKTINILPPLKGGNEVWFNSERCMVVNGQPFYPRGFFGCAENAFPLIAQAGGNVVHSYVVNTFDLPKIIKFLDDAQANGLKVVLKPYYKFNIGFFGFTVKGKKQTTFDQNLQNLAKELVDGISNHPAFLGWYLYDEPRGAEYSRNLKTVYEFLREYDPYHVVVGCDNSSEGCINKVGHCDVHWVDIYPSPYIEPKDYLSIPITSLYNQLHNVVEKVGREAVCYVPQAFERNSFNKKPGNYRSMTYRELRASVFAGITAGVRGTVPYKIGDIKTKYRELVPNAGIFSDPNMKLGFLKGIMPELNALNDALLAPIAAKQATVDKEDIRQITLDHNGALYVFLLNLKPEPKGLVNVTWPGKDASKVRLLGGNGKLLAKGSTIAIDFGKYDAFVLTDDANAKPTVNVLAVEKEIEKENK